MLATKTLTIALGATALASATALALVSAPEPAQDPVPLYPENYRVLLENDRVRVMDFRLRKGGTEVMHSHPRHVTYVLQDFKIRFTFPDGTTRVREAKAGEVLYTEPVTHSPLNVGENDAHGIIVEMKGTAPERGAVDAGAGPEPLTALTFITGLPGKEEELRRELLALAAPTRAEPGSLAYDLYQSTSEPNRFVRFEQWRDAAALEDHKRTPHLRASFQKRKAQGWSTEITLWKPVAGSR
ncbi:MAG: antibiotic biosynthesis monooxygenase [Planctomycetes bacterium]|nr:antibiotic biosynthesis monooxygenase [Planctomycetota bacterium]